jgi:hypothetical protein
MNMIAECFVDVLQDKGLLQQYVLEGIVKELDCVDDLFAGTHTFAVDVLRGVDGSCYLCCRR